MKRISLGVCLSLLCFFTAFAQSPQYIPYQAVARDAAGNLLINQAVSLRFTIRESNGTTGTIDYQETQSSTTNSLGLFSVNIGNGTAVSGTFSAIPWGNNVAKFTQVEIDPTGHTSYVNMGASQLMSVPYALYAGSASSVVNGVSSVTANNGLTATTGTTPNITLGGTLLNATTITQGANMLTDNLNGTGDFAIQHNGTTAMYVLGNHSASTDGYVGIGTATPLGNADIEATSANTYGHLIVNRNNSGAVGGELSIDNNAGGNGAQAVLAFGTDGTTNFDASGNNLDNAEIRAINDNGTNNATDLQFSNWSGAAENVNMVITSTGYVGIGTTAPNSPLHVVVPGTSTLSGSVGAVQVYQPSLASGIHSHVYLKIGVDEAMLYDEGDISFTYAGGAGSNTNYLGLGMYGEGPNLVVTGNGDVGIGTTSPTSTLTVNGTTGTTNFQMTNGATNGYILQSDASGNASWVSPSAAVVLAGTGLSYSGTTLNSVWTASGNNIYNNNSAYVGIGTATPTQLFEIVGSNTTNSKAVIISGDGNYGQLQIASPSGSTEASIGFISSETTTGNSAASATTGGVWTMGAGSWGNLGSTFALGNVAYSSGAAMFTATSGGNIGIDLQATTAVNALDVNGGVAIGTYAGVSSTPAPANGLIVSGNVGIGNASPVQSLTITNAADIITGGAAGETSTHALGLETGTTTSDYILYMGADKTNKLGYIQAVNYGVAIANIVLNPRGGYVGVGTTNPLSLLHANGTLTVGTPSGGTTPATGTLAFNNSSSTKTVSIAAGNTTTGYSLTLPLTQGAANSVLSNNGSGTLSWTTTVPCAHAAYAFPSNATSGNIAGLMQTGTTLTVGNYNFYVSFTPGSCNGNYLEVENTNGSSYTASYYEDQKWNGSNTGYGTVSSFNGASTTSLTNNSYVALAPESGNCIGNSGYVFGSFVLFVSGDPALPEFRITVAANIPSTSAPYTGGSVSLIVEKLN